MTNLTRATSLLPTLPVTVDLACDSAAAMVPEVMLATECANALADASNAYEPGNFYAALLNDLVDTVLEDEAHLFSDTEVELLQTITTIPRTARALLAHLLQRQDRYLSTGSLTYTDVPDPPESATILHEHGLVLLQSASSLDWPELLGRLSLDNLRALVPHSHYLSRAALVQAMLEAPMNAQSQPQGQYQRQCRRQPEPSRLPTRPQRQLQETQPKARQLTLFHFRPTPSPTPIKAIKREPAHVAAPAPFPNASDVKRVLARDHIRPQAEALVGPSVRIPGTVRELIDRSALLYYRELPEPAKPANASWLRPRPVARGEVSLTTAILARSGRRRFASYAAARSPLWSTRDEVVAYHRAVEQEREMEWYIETGDWDLGATAGLEVRSAWNHAVSQAQAQKSEEEERVQALSIPHWTLRFRAANSQTRVLSKAAACLGRLKRYREEAELLQSLLNQRIFRQHKRGEWVERLALIWMQYAPIHFPPYPHPHRSRKATQVSREHALRLCVEAIEDPCTHGLYLPALQRRIMRLEGLLRTPYGDQHDFSHMALRIAKTVYFTAVRLDRMAPVTDERGLWGLQASIAPTGSSGGGGGTDGNRPPPQKRVRLERTTADAQRETYHTQTRLGMGSVWRGLDGHACRVEDLVLQHYAQSGFKGRHCEGGLLHMLVSLLLWDVIFAPIPGVLQSPFQNAPLDLHSPEFARSRAAALTRVLAEVEQHGPQLVADTDAAQRPCGPFVVGCCWDAYSHDELVQVAEALGGEALAKFCQAFANDWSASASGMPDLLLWQHPASGAGTGAGTSRPRIKLVEVKGPGDQLRENQKRWIDLLCMWGVPVEVALVREEVSKE